MKKMGLHIVSVRLFDVDTPECTNWGSNGSTKNRMSTVWDRMEVHGAHTVFSSTRVRTQTLTTSDSKTKIKVKIKEEVATTAVSCINKA